MAQTNGFPHNYEEAVHTQWNFIKSGERSILWGAIKWSTGRWNETRTHLGVCKYCGKDYDGHILKRDRLD